MSDQWQYNDNSHQKQVRWVSRLIILGLTLLAVMFFFTIYGQHIITFLHLEPWVDVATWTSIGYSLLDRLNDTIVLTLSLLALVVLYGVFVSFYSMIFGGIPAMLVNWGQPGKLYTTLLGVMILLVGLNFSAVALQHATTGFFDPRLLAYATFGSLVTYIYLVWLGSQS